MKIYIFADMEGISGISNSSFVRKDENHYDEGRRYYTMDINACIEGCFQAGADRVIVKDGHSSGDHALWEKFDKRAELIQGEAEERFPGGLKECDGIIFLGYHAMAGTYKALLDHTYSGATVQNMWLNGKLAGELAFDAAIAASYGVPAIMTSGDDKLCREALDWLPDIVTSQVKTGTSRQGAHLLSIEKAHNLIQKNTEEAVRKIGNIKLLKVAQPVKIRMELVERNGVPHRKGLKIIDGRTVEAEGNNIEEVFWSLFR